MTRQSPPELFAQRPVRSDFGRQSGGPVLNIRRLMMLIGAIVVAVAIGIGVNYFGGEETPSGEVPTVKAELPIKEKPDQPGGIDIPHQDVTVFQQLENKPGEAPKPGVEHLLPEPETPQPVPAAEPAAMAEAVAPPQGSGKIEDLPPPITEAVPESAPTVLSPPPPTVSPKAEKLMDSGKTAVQDVKPAPVPQKAEPAKAASVKKAEAPAPVAAKKETVKAVAVATKKAKPAETPKATPEAAKAEAAMARLPKELFTTGEVPAAASSSAAPAAASVKKTVAAESAGGKAHVQLASMPDQSAAQAEAKRLQAKYAGLLGGASLHVVSADLGAKGTYYRIVSTGMGAAKAKAICASIVKQKGSCLAR